VALPAYERYTRKVRFAELILMTKPHRIVVEECAAVAGSLTNCVADKIGFPSSTRSFTNGPFLSFTVNIGSGDLAVPGFIQGLAFRSELDENGTVGLPITYDLVPTMSNGQITWEVGGSCKSERLC